MIRCAIFDLDGVVVDTACFHFLAWAELAHELGFTLTEAVADSTKGVSRMVSLDIVLRAGGLEGCFTTVEKEQLADRKNGTYLRHVAQMTSGDVLPGVVTLLHELRERGVKVVLGSASKNARLILERCGIEAFFDAVVDGTQVVHAKPDPEVFLRGAELVSVDPRECVVFEDARAGIEAATRAGMRSVGVGDGEALVGATLCVRSFEGLFFDDLRKQID